MSLNGPLLRDRISHDELQELYSRLLESFRAIQERTAAPLHKPVAPTAPFQPHCYIPYDETYFMCLLRDVAKVSQILENLNFKRDRFFLDVGCGIGFKMLIASRFHYKVHGIEINEQYLAVAEKILGYVPDFQLFNQNAIEFPYYGNYDLIYFFRPIMDQKGEVALEKSIFTEAKEGAIILSVYGVNIPKKEFPENVHPVFGNSNLIWIKLSDIELYNALLKQLEPQGKPCVGKG